MILDIASHIYKKLTTNTTISSLVGDKVFPIVTKTEVDFPFIVFERDGVAPSYNKEGIACAEVTSSIYVLTEDYTQGITIADAAIKALSKVSAVYPTYMVRDAVMTGASEEFTSNTYVQQLNFTFIISE